MGYYNNLTLRIPWVYITDMSKYHNAILEAIPFYHALCYIETPPCCFLYLCLPELSWRRHQMGTFSALLALCAGNSPVPVNSPRKGQWRGALMLALICVWINDWVNNREAGDLRRHRGNYDVIVMYTYTESGQYSGCAKRFPLCM